MIGGVFDMVRFGSITPFNRVYPEDAFARDFERGKVRWWASDVGR